MDDPPKPLYRRLLPQRTNDAIAFGMVLIVVPAVAAFELVFAFPSSFYHSSASYLWNLVFLSIVILNLYGNFLMIILTDASGLDSDLPAVLKPGFKYCYICHLNAPPRAYHCSVCERCILKRDHHCCFTGCCIGYKNHRYYLMFLAYVWILCVYALWLNWSMIWNILGGYSVGTAVCLIFPQFALIFGKFSFLQMICAAIQTSSIAAVVLSSYALVCQLRNISKGVTYEELHFSTTALSEYNLGFLLNIKDVLGQWWYLTWICPLIRSPLLTDGLKYFKKTAYETTKDI